MSPQTCSLIELLGQIIYTKQTPLICPNPNILGIPFRENELDIFTNPTTNIRSATSVLSISSIAAILYFIGYVFAHLAVLPFVTLPIQPDCTPKKYIECFEHLDSIKYEQMEDILCDKNTSKWFKKSIEIPKIFDWM